MPRTAKAKVALPIGLDNVHIADVLTDTEESATYGTPEFFARAIKATITPILAEGTLESEDEVEIDESAIIGYNVSIEASQLDDYMRAKIFGHKIDADGGIVYSENDKAPKLALLFRSLLSDRQNYKYAVLYNGSFKPNEETYETKKKESITYQVEGAIAGNFYTRAKDKVARYTLRSDTEQAGAKTKIASWFESVPEPGEAASELVETQAAQTASKPSNAEG